MGKLSGFLEPISEGPAEASASGCPSTYLPPYPSGDNTPDATHHTQIIRSRGGSCPWVCSESISTGEHFQWPRNNKKPKQKAENRTKNPKTRRRKAETKWRGRNKRSGRPEQNGEAENEKAEAENKKAEAEKEKEVEAGGGKAEARSKKRTPKK